MVIASNNIVTFPPFSHDLKKVSGDEWEKMLVNGFLKAKTEETE